MASNKYMNINIFVEKQTEHANMFELSSKIDHKCVEWRLEMGEDKIFASGC